MYDSLFSRSGLSLERMKNFLMVVESGSIAKAVRPAVTAKTVAPTLVAGTVVLVETSKPVSMTSVRTATVRSRSP